MDGTPIYDIKPYLPYADAHPEALGGFAPSPKETIEVKSPPELLQKLPEEKRPRLALVDGNREPGLPLPTQLVVKGDGTSAHIAAASVLAKVTRDHLMTEYAREYPGYGWEKNKGYGSKEHYEGIAKYGITPLHRKSFLKNLTEKHHDG